MKCFLTLEENFVSLRGHVICSIYSLSKLKTRLDVISNFVKLPKQTEKSRTCTPKLVPKLVHHFITIFHMPTTLGRSSAIG